MPYLKASGIFNALVRQKTPGADGTPYQHTDHEGRSTGILRRRGLDRYAVVRENSLDVLGLVGRDHSLPA